MGKYKVDPVCDVKNKNIQTDNINQHIKAFVNIQRTKETETEVNIIAIQHGLKVEVRDFVLKELQNNQYIQDNYQLNIKRVNRWWYSVYFKEIGGK